MLWRNVTDKHLKMAKMFQQERKKNPTKRINLNIPHNVEG